MLVMAFLVVVVVLWYCRRAEGGAGSGVGSGATTGAASR